MRQGDIHETSRERGGLESMGAARDADAATWRANRAAVDREVDRRGPDDVGRSTAGEPGGER